MRRIVLCHTCSRRYDASKKEPGWRFHCRCGEELTVEASESHTAEVVRCSSCGGPREKGVNRCGFCGADFTIHERDLNTVCPECFARVSDRAKHCCQCGTRLTAEEYAGQETEFACPVCGDEVHLASRPLGQEKVNILECPLCAGLWLGHEAFDHLRDRVKRQGVQPGEATVPQSKPQTARQQKGPRYRACVHCGKLMQRRAYGQGSGVVIDTCRDHGIWFDAEELQHILAWILKGGQERQPLGRQQESQQVSKEPIFGPRMQPGDSTIGDGSCFDFGFSDPDRPDLLTALVGEVAEGLFGLFKR